VVGRSRDGAETLRLLRALLPDVLVLDVRMPRGDGLEVLATLRREAAAWNRRVNRKQVKINWRFDRKATRRKFGYKRPSIKRSKN